MGGLPGGKFTAMRAISMFLNLAAVIMAVVFIGTGIDKAGHEMIMILAPILLTVFLIFELKTEYDFLDDHRPMIILGTLILIIVLEIVIASVNALLDSMWLIYLPIIVGQFALIVTWHYTLTIYKNEKQRFYMGFVGFLVLYVGFGITFVGVGLTLTVAIFVLVAVVMDGYAEQQLLKKKLLNFI